MADMTKLLASYEDFRIDPIDIVVHFRARVRGTANNIRRFYDALNTLDIDCPIAHEITYKHCPECGGDEWCRPCFGPHELKVLGAQFNVNVKIYRYVDANKCTKPLEEKKVA